MKYRVKLTPTASNMFNRLHPKIRKELKSELKNLYHAPYAGKALQHELEQFRSLKIKRYRAIYQVDDESGIIIVYAIGHRRDIYDIIRLLTERQ